MKEAIEKILGDKVDATTLLKGDASTRQYHRVRLSNGDNVIACYNNSESEVLKFVTVNEIYQSHHVRTPNVIAHEDKILILEDCGENHFIDTYLVEKDLNLYFPMIDVLQEINAIEDKMPNPDFDQTKFLEECNFSKDFFAISYLKIEKEVAELFDDFHEYLIKELLTMKYSNQHRDFHSKNIMIKGHEKIIIDHQDSRRGPYLYDLCSLTEDCYIPLEQPTKDKLKNYYAKSSAYDDGDYNICACQRVYKAIGTFVRLAETQNKTQYLKYVEPAFKNLILLLEELKQKDSLFGEVKEVLIKAQD